MSELRVEVVKISGIEKVPDADRLELARIEGWQCVVQKGTYKEGDLALYIPIDSILPQPLEEFIFPPGSKIKLEKHRVRSIKIRKALSQGMLLPLEDIDSYLKVTKKYKLGDDLATALGITKYEPPFKETHQGQAKQVKRKLKHPDFHEYSDLQNFKWYPNLFTTEDDVVILEKIHGSNFRCGYLEYNANTIWKKIKKFFGFAPKYEFVYGSHGVQLQYKTFYNGNIYWEMVEKYDLKNILQPGEILYGEVYGHGVQKGYHYGCQENERKLVVFDIKKDGVYQNHLYVKRFCDRYKLPHAPIEYVGKYPGADVVKEKYVDGPSCLNSSQRIREGVVIKSFIETTCYMGRKILKWKNDSFLLESEDNTH